MKKLEFLTSSSLSWIRLYHTSASTNHPKHIIEFSLCTYMWKEHPTILTSRPSSELFLCTCVSFRVREPRPFSMRAIWSIQIDFRSRYVLFFSPLFMFNRTRLHRWIPRLLLLCLLIQSRHGWISYLKYSFNFFTFLSRCFFSDRSRAKKSRIQEVRESWDAQGRSVLGNARWSQPRELAVVEQDVNVFDVLFDWLALLSTII